jgi:predicted nuclease with TOPRIM domain
MSVDDYLDLLNYAKAINDGQWQADIIESLKNLQAVAATDTREENVRELWVQFDEVNAVLMELFDKLRENDQSVEQHRLKERIWELKLERIRLAKRIQSKYIGIR